METVIVNKSALARELASYNGKSFNTLRGYSIDRLQAELAQHKEIQPEPTVEPTPETAETVVQPEPIVEVVVESAPVVETPAQPEPAQNETVGDVAFLAKQGALGFARGPFQIALINGEVKASKSGYRKSTRRFTERLATACIPHHINEEKKLILGVW